MATTKQNIGKIPIMKGEYQEGTTYQRLNQVTMLGSTYQSKIDGNTSAPAQMGADGAVENINMDKWLCIAVGNVSSAKKVVYNNETSGLEAGNVQAAIDETNTKIQENVDFLNYKVFATTIKSKTAAFEQAIPSPFIKNGVSVSVEAVDLGDNSNISVYIIYKDNSNKQLLSLSKEKPIQTAVISLDSSKEFDFIKLYGEKGNYTVKVGVDNLDLRIKENAENISEKAGYYAQISNWCYILADSNKRILGGFLDDGSFEFLKGIPSPIKKELKKKVDTKDGFCLIEQEIADSIQYKNNSYLYAICDALTRLLFYFDKNANCHCSKDLSVGGIFNASGLSENLINYIKERTVDESYPIFVSGENDAAYTIVGKDSDGAKNNMNVSVGYQNLRYNTGTKNVAIGNQNLMFNSANGVVAIGYHSLFRNTTGYDNCCVGAESCDDNITGYSNTAFGNYSLQRNNKGSENTAIGRYAMNGNERDEEGKPGSAFDKNNGNLSCNRNTAVGCEALFNIRSGGKNIAIGYQASMNLVDYFNTIVIGNEVSPTDNHQIIIGTSQHQEVRIAGKKILFNEDGTVNWVE